jgi:hypothetical protein
MGSPTATYSGTGWRGSRRPSLRPWVYALRARPPDTTMLTSCAWSWMFATAVAGVLGLQRVIRGLSVWLCDREFAGSRSRAASEQQTRTARERGGHTKRAGLMHSLHAFSKGIWCCLDVWLRSNRILVGFVSWSTMGSAAGICNAFNLNTTIYDSVAQDSGSATAESEREHLQESCI